MIRLSVTRGRSAGASVVIRGFPAVLGRGAIEGLNLEDPGVWERHATITLTDGEGFMLRCRPEATLLVNGDTTAQRRLRNGDVLGIGGAQVHFSLSENRQYGFRLREALTWVSLGLLCVVQLVLIYLVLP